MSNSTKTSDRPAIGWREWVHLPDLGIAAVKVKVDTGARSSALHAHDVQIFRRGSRDMVRFKVHPLQRSSRETVECEAELLDQRWVKGSHGTETFRAVIETDIELMGERWPIEVTLVNRDAMGFRMLLGRQAVRRRMVVDPGRSFLAGKAPSTAGNSEKSRKTKRKRSKAGNEGRGSTRKQVRK